MPASPAIPVNLTANDIARFLVALGISTEAEARAYATSFELESADSHNPAAFLAHLNRLNVVTAYQAERILEGEHHRLTIGQYLITMDLCPGTLGTMYRAVHTGNKKVYAVLALPMRSLWNAHLAKEQVAIFAPLAAEVALVPFCDIDTANGVHYIAWPYIDGETLEERVLQTGALTMANVVTILAKVASALHACHKLGLAHGALRPSLIQLHADNQPRLLELGVGTIIAHNIVSDDSFLDTISTANAATVSIDCTAPETIQDPTKRNHYTDQYALGCIATFALSGQYPFPHGTVVDKMIAHSTAKPATLHSLYPEIPPELSAIVERLLAKTPAERFANMLEVEQALIAVAAVAPNRPAVGFLAKTDTETTNKAFTIPSTDGPISAMNRAAKGKPASLSDITFDIPEVNTETDDSVNRPRLKLNSDLSQRARNSTQRPVTATPTPSPSRPIEVPNNAIKPVILRGRMETPRPDSNPHMPAGLAQTNFQIELPDPIIWSRSTESTPDLFTERKVPTPPPRPPMEVFLNKLKGLLLFWKPPSEIVQLSLFGPLRLVPGQSYQLQAYLHTPENYGNVRTLARALLQEAELMVSGYLDWPIAYGQEVALHLAIANTGISKPLEEAKWQGQAVPKTFNVFVPWESPGGATSAALSAGVNNIRAAGLPFLVDIASRFA